MAQENDGEGVKFIVIGVVGLAVLSIAYFGVIKPVLDAAGITKDKEEREGDKAEERLSRSQVLSPDLYLKNKALVSIGSGKANILASNVYNGKWGGWGGLSDDEDLGVGAITGAGTKVNISYVSHIFNSTYGGSMHSYLDYLEPEDWTTIDDYIATTKKF